MARQVVYTGSRGGSDWALYIRNLDQLDSRLLPGTEGAVAPEFSPNGKWIAFGAADGSLKKIIGRWRPRSPRSARLTSVASAA